MNSKTNTVRAILLDASECDRPEADHPATIEICADDLQRILERHITEPAQCLHQIAEPAANLTSELADMLERSVTGLGHYRNSQNWSEADEEHIYECNALLERFNSSDDEREAAPQAVQPAVPLPTVELIGVKDGKETNLGQVPMPPRMRARELLRDVGFTGLDDDDGEGAYAMGACEQLIEYCQAYYAAPAHPAEGVPAPEMNEDGYLPCPFCGSHRVSLSTGQTGDGTPWHYVECESCAGTAEPEKWNERATQPAAQGLDAEPKLNAAWKSRLLDGAPLSRDKYGCGSHPALPIFFEGVKCKDFFEALGIELRLWFAEYEMEAEAYEAMSDGFTEDGENYNAWTPKKPEGDGWCLVAIFDTEDGAACWWLRDAALAAQAKQGGA